jgi:antibiotic biosynthesis monooxygenase (ABM) superfamily enzyme
MALVIVMVEVEVVVVVVVVVLYMLEALIVGAMAALLPQLPPPLRLLLTIAVEVAILTWWLMPRLTRWLAPWIYPRRSVAG